MTTKTLQRQHGDFELNRVQDNIEDHTKALVKNPLVGGRLVTGVDVPINSALTPVEVDHKLGRKPRGWIVVRRILVGVASRQAPIYEDPDNNSKETILKLYTTGDAAVIDLWVF